MTPLPPRPPNPELRRLKAAAQRLKASFKVGNAGLTPAFIASLNTALEHHELLKVKFEAFKEQKRQLAPQLAEQTGSHLIMQVGNVVVLYRARLRSSSYGGQASAVVGRDSVEP